ncbi:AAA family ATPase [Streptomyces shenzhenensis]|uniref:ATP-binding protein n=1 Tax=Streptomyces shenzhenensis TaxID=943815 RepID=UPI003D8FC934
MTSLPPFPVPAGTGVPAGRRTANREPAAGTAPVVRGWQDDQLMVTGWRRTTVVHIGPDYPADPGILGRAAELSRLEGLLGAVDGTGPQVLVLVGEPGAGKSTLVDWTAEQGRARGLRTLRVRGSEGEAGLGLSGVHQLLHPLLPGDALPAPQRAALDRAFGVPATPHEAALDQMSLCISVLALIDDSAARRPLLLLVDDVQWLDLGSVDVLGFLARRLEGKPVVLLLAAREEAVPARFDRDFPQVTVGPLSRTAAGLLLDAQPHPPRGRARTQILQQAAGNPLALIELPRALTRAGPARARTAGPRCRSPHVWRTCSPPTSPACPSPRVRHCSWSPPPAPGTSPTCCAPPRRWTSSGRLTRRSAPGWCGSRTARCCCATRWCARPSTRRRPSPSGGTPISPWPPRSPGNRTAGPGTWPPPRRTRTRTSPTPWRRVPSARVPGAGTRRPRPRWNAPRS